MVRLARSHPSSTDAGDRLAVAELVSYSFEVDDERVSSESDRDDQTRHTRQRQAEAHAPREDADGEVRENTHHDQRRDDDEPECAVDDQRVDRDERQSDEARDQADLQLLGTEGGRDRVGAHHGEAQRKGAVLELICERLGGLLRETSGDGRLAVEDDAVHRRSRKHRPVEHERELVQWRLGTVEALADLAEGGRYPRRRRRG